METASNAGTRPAEETLSLSTWQVDNTRFGQILRGPCGRVLFPPDLFDEVDKRMKMLSKRCDLSRKLQCLEETMYKEFHKKPPIYDPDELKHSALGLEPILYLILFCQQ
ncbi:hypothetical protein ABFA07_021703 [Porites harrisoni]